MRRLFVLLVVLGMFLAMPLAAANAQEERFEADIHAVAVPVGVAPDGAEIWQGTFEVVIGGAVVETGTITSHVYTVDGSAVHFRTEYVDDLTGDVANTTGKAFLTGFDETTGVLSYVVTEKIVSSTSGIRGHARGFAFVTLDENGVGVLLEGWNHWILNF